MDDAPLNQSEFKPDSTPDAEYGADDWLTDRGGWLLFAFGLALVVIAVWFRASPAIAPVFAFVGPACVVLAVLLSRTEGPIELTPGSLKLVLRTLRRRAQRDRSLRPAQKAEVLEAAAVEIAGLAQVLSPSPREVKRIANQAYVRARTEAVSLERRVQEWLEQQGWRVRPYDSNHDIGFDLVAERDSERFYIEVKLSRGPIFANRLLSWITRLDELHALDPAARVGLFLSAPPLTQAELALLARSKIEIYFATPEGGFVRITTGAAQPSLFQEQESDQAPDSRG